MENTLENKMKFMAQYWGQVVFLTMPSEPTNDVVILTSRWMDYNYDRALPCLLLTPLLKITDEDAIEVYKRTAKKESDNRLMIYKGKYHCTLDNTQESADYLRSKGYALPWMGLSVEKLIEYGWVVLQ